MICLCLCHLGIRPLKGEVKAFLKTGIDGTDPVGVATACSQCAPRHAECLDGVRKCRCGHEKWKHTATDGCAGTYTERCRCLHFAEKEVGV